MNLYRIALRAWLRTWLVLLTLVWGANTFAISEAVTVNKVSVAFGMDRAPYLFSRDTNQGLEIEIVTKALKQRGIVVQVKQLPNRLVQTALLDDASLDATAGVQDDPSSPLFYSNVYINYENYVISRKADAIQIDHLGDLKGKKIAIWSHGVEELGAGFFDLFNPKDRAQHTPYFYEVNDQANQLNLLINRDVDIVVMDKTVFSWYLNLLGAQHRIADFVFHDVLPEVTGYHVAFRDRYMRDRFNQGLEMMIGSGEYQQLVDYYLSAKGVTIQRQISRDEGEKDGMGLTGAEKSWLRRNPSVTFTGDPDWLPFEVFDVHGLYQGIVADHISLIEQKLGFYFRKIDPQMWSLALEMATRKEVDIISAGLGNQSLYATHKPIEPYISNPVVIVKTDKDDFVGDLEELYQDNIAVMGAASYASAMLSEFPNHHFVKVGSLTQGLEGVSSGLYDAMVTSMALANYNIGDLGLYNLRIVGKTNYEVEVTLFVSRDKPILFDIINKAISSISTREQQQIMNRWIKQRYVEKTDYQLSISIIGVFIVIIAIFLYWNRRLSEEVRLRKATEVQLNIAKEKAELATQAKTTFLSNMSHEIRTPMNAILGFTDLLSEGVENKQHLAFIKTIQSAGNALLTLINDILDLSKIEAGKLDIHPAPCDPYELFNEVAKLFMVELRKKQLDFVLDFDKNIPTGLMLDTVRARQILFNLIGNAVKFTDLGCIRLIVRQIEDEHQGDTISLLIAIEDTGVGIAASDLEHVFGSFDQAHHQDNQKYGGTGLGLPISQRLAQLMNGEISVTSTVNVGTRFELLLRDIPLVPHISKNRKISPNDLGQQVIFKPARVLIVDDVDINRLLVQECFSGTQVTFFSVSSGPEAISILQQNSVDLILMDIRMPGMDGYQAARLARKYTKAPILALSAIVNDPLNPDIIDNPFDGYIKKPVFKAELFLALQDYLPYQIQLIGTKSLQKDLEVVLDKQALAASAMIIDILSEQLLPQWQAIRVNNRMSDIKKFAQTIEQLGQQYRIDACLDYAKVLTETVDACDIVGIKTALQRFPNLSDVLLKQLKPEAKTAFFE